MDERIWKLEHDGLLGNDHYRLPFEVKRSRIQRKHMVGYGVDHAVRAHAHVYD